MSEPILVRPEDLHNRRLVRNVHPPDWENPDPAPVYNLVVIGGGTAGLVSAVGAAALGARVALIERELLGGDCLNVGCVPSKALIRSARAFAQVPNAGAYGIEVPEGVRVEFGRVMERMRRLRAAISPRDSAERLSDLGIDVFLGEGRGSQLPMERRWTGKSFAFTARSSLPEDARRLGRFPDSKRPVTLRTRRSSR